MGFINSLKGILLFRPAANRLQSNVKKLGIFDPKYKWYALYSWGCPLIVSIVTFGMHNMNAKSTRNKKKQEKRQNLIYKKLHILIKSI